MKYLSLLLLFIPLHLFSQDSITHSQFRFTIIDEEGKDITSQNGYEANIADVFLTDSSTSDISYVFTKLDYSKKDSCWILSQDEPLGYAYKIDIYRSADTVNQALLQLRKMTLIYYGYNEEKNSGCQFCLCNDIPFKPGEFTLDIPKRIESWLYIRNVSINIKNIPTSFRDISSIQNWMFRTGK